VRVSGVELPVVDNAEFDGGGKLHITAGTCSENRCQLYPDVSILNIQNA
jgi:hypothetical protein